MKGGGAGGTNVSVSVTVNQDGSASENSRATDSRGQQLGQLVKAQVMSVIVEQKRPGGLLA
jgi:hypothetical protein